MKNILKIGKGKKTKKKEKTKKKKERKSCRIPFNQSGDQHVQYVSKIFKKNAFHRHFFA